MNAPHTDSPESETAVQVTQVAAEWFVRVIDSGDEIIRIFGVESRAIDFAAEQCLRLRLEKYDRL